MSLRTLPPRPDRAARLARALVKLIEEHVAADLVTDPADILCALAIVGNAIHQAVSRESSLQEWQDTLKRAMVKKKAHDDLFFEYNPKPSAPIKPIKG